MKASELIAQLQREINQYGDLHVQVASGQDCRFFEISEVRAKETVLWNTYLIKEFIGIVGDMK